LQKAFYPDSVNFRAREEENGVSEMQEPQNQAADLLLSSGDLQEKLTCPAGMKTLPALEEALEVLRQR
jgi:hypothetical protein